MSDYLTFGLDKLVGKDKEITFLTKGQIMKKCHISSQTLHKWLYEMGLKFHKMGHKRTSKVLVKSNDLEEFINKFYING